MKDKKSENINEIYDFLILGAGGTGLAAGMYAGRLGLKTLILGTSHSSELPIGGVITTTDIVENYPGFSKISGFELAKKIEEHARNCDLVKIKQEKAIEIKKEENFFLIKTEKNQYKTKTILFATGTKWRKLPETIKGAREFEKNGIHYCALCDALLYKNKTVAVLGGSNSAIKDALVLSKHAKKVYIIYRGEKIRAEPANLKKTKDKENIVIITKRNIVEIKGERFVESIILDYPYNQEKKLNIDGIFVAIGHTAISELAKPLGVELNKKGEIKIDHKTSETNIKGIFAAGDVTDKDFKQLITGVADGCTAAYHAYEYLTKTKLTLYDS